MGLIIAILLGALVGWVASSIFQRDHGFFGYMVIGIIGSLIGRLISWIITGDAQAALSLDFWPLVWSLVGSILFVMLLNALQDRPNRPQI